MSLNLGQFNPAHPDRAPVPDSAEGYDDFGLRANWGEKVVTVVATSLALLVVAAIAMLMGMA